MVMSVVGLLVLIDVVENVDVVEIVEIVVSGSTVIGGGSVSLSARSNFPDGWSIGVDKPKEVFHNLDVLSCVGSDVLDATDVNNTKIMKKVFNK